MSSVLFKAFMMAESWNICVYQRVVKPPQTVLDFVLLKDKTIMVTIGMYKKSRMRRQVKSPGKTVLSGYVSSKCGSLPFFIVFGDERHTQ